MIPRHRSKKGARPSNVALTPAEARALPQKSPVSFGGKSARAKANGSNGSGWFRSVADKSAAAVGSPWAFGAGLAIILIWGALGPVFHYADTWQLVINTGTTIITFLMVFLIQSTQNRDAKVIQLKLDELLRGVKGARNTMIDLEKLSDEELLVLEKEFELLRKHEAKPKPPADE